MITVDVKELCICLVLLALFVLLIYLILLVKNAIVTVKNLNKVTGDAKVVTQIVADRSTEVNEAVGDMGAALKDLSGAVKGNHDFISAVTNVGKATASTVNYFKSSKK